MKLRRVRLAPRLLSFADQGVSTLSNLALAIFIAQVSTPTQFGTYAIAASVYWLALGFTRAVVCEPLLILKQELEEVAAHPTRVVLAVGTAVGVALAIAVALSGAAFGQSPLLALAVCLPALIAQDTTRYVFFATTKVGGALFTDAVWLMGFLIAGVSTLTFAREHASVDSLILLWGLAAAISVVATVLLSRLRPTVSGVRAVVRTGRRTSLDLLGDFVAGSAATQFVVLAIPLVSALSTLGAYKGAQVAMGPFNVILTAVTVVALPRIARMSRDSAAPSEILRAATRVGATLGAAGAGYTLILLAIPNSIGAAAFGETWQQASRLVPFVGAQLALQAAATGAVLALRGTKNTRLALRLRIVFTPWAVSAPLAGVFIADDVGLGWALVTVATSGLLLWWITTIRTLRGSLSSHVQTGHESELATSPPRSV